MNTKESIQQEDVASSESQQISQEALYFKRFIVCALACVGALIAIVYANLNLEPSTQQELIALVGLIVSIPSGITAFYYYLRLIVSRFKQFKDR